MKTLLKISPAILSCIAVATIFYIYYPVEYQKCGIYNDTNHTLLIRYLKDGKPYTLGKYSPGQITILNITKNENLCILLTNENEETYTLGYINIYQHIKNNPGYIWILGKSIQRGKNIIGLPKNEDY
jgi:hypothetical protein